ncbi:hypothetical protein DFJ74DRAFT_445419 [Hyaloraphidium curvatum]|nr:hypothetical protein DFJ74DRAFT_445419 [Hyaloraphidium curvatum]
MTAVKVIRGFLAFNAALDFALAYTAAGKGMADNFPSLSAEGVAAINAGLPVHGLLRAFAAYAFESPEARRVAQLSYLGEVLMVAGLRKDFDWAKGKGMVIGPILLIAAIEYFGFRA